MTINLHLLHHPLEHDSRVLRETRTVLGARLFDEVHVSTLEDESPLEQTDDEGRRISGVALRSRTWPKRFLAQAVKYFEWHWRVVRRYRRSPITVIHCHDWQPLAIAADIQRHTGARIIYDAHELETAVNGQSRLESLVAGSIERRYLPRSSVVLTVSEAIRQHYIDTYGVRTELVMNCPDELTVPKSRMLRDELGIPDTATIYIYVGQLGRGRGVEIALEAFKDADPRDRVMVFMGYGPLQGRIRNVAATSPGIFLKDSVPPDQVVLYLSSADVGLSLVEDVSLSDRLCLPNKLFESLMAGLPVIVPNLPEMARVVRERRCGVVLDSMTAKGLTDGIERLKAMDLGALRAGALAASKTFSWREQEKVLLRTYRDVVEESGVRQRRTN